MNIILIIFIKTIQYLFIFKIYILIRKNKFNQYTNYVEFQKADYKVYSNNKKISTKIIIDYITNILIIKLELIDIFLFTTLSLEKQYYI